MPKTSYTFKIDPDSAYSVGGNYLEYLFFSDEIPEIAVIGTSELHSDRTDGYHYIYLVDVLTKAYRGTKVKAPVEGIFTVSLSEINKLKKFSTFPITEYGNYNEAMDRAKDRYISFIMRRELGC